MRPSNVVKMTLVLAALLATVYTIYVYIGIAFRLSLSAENIPAEHPKDSVPAKDENIVVKPEKEEFIEYNQVVNPDLPNVEMVDNVCDMKTHCTPEKEIPMQIVSGAANIIGPSICVDGKWLMSNSIGNVDRGMNVAVVDGSTGILKNAKVFDLYGSESGPFETFLNELKDNDVVLIATYDDAAQRLRDGARGVLSNLGSKEAKSLTFRDNWIFVGGKNLIKQGTVFEKYLHSEKDKNRFGNWPATVALEGCLPKL